MDVDVASVRVAINAIWEVNEIVPLGQLREFKDGFGKAAAHKGSTTCFVGEHKTGVNDGVEEVFLKAAVVQCDAQRLALLYAERADDWRRKLRAMRDRRG